MVRPMDGLDSDQFRVLSKGEAVILEFLKCHRSVAICPLVPSRTPNGERFQLLRVVVSHLASSVQSYI